MGKYVRAQDNNDSEYVRAIYKWVVNQTFILIISR